MSPAGNATARAMAGPVVADGILQDGEIIILTVKPSGAYVLLRSLPVLVAVAVVLGILLTFEKFNGPVDDSPRAMLLLGCAIAAVLQLLSAGFRWLGQLYILTNRRLLRLRGVFRAETSWAELTSIDEVIVTHSPLERPLGLGSLNFSTTDNDNTSAPPSWENINRPYEIASEVRKAISHAHNTSPRT